MEEKPRKRRTGRLIVLAAVIAVVAAATYEIVHSLRHVYEPNAHVQANFTTLSSSVNGNIEAIHVAEGERVTAGQRLVSMDDDVAALDVKTLEAELERERAVRLQVERELEYFQAELDDRIRTRLASVDQLRRELLTLEERRAIAISNLERNNKLLDQSAVSRQGIDDAQDKLLDVTSAIRALQTQIVVKDKEVDELRGSKSRDSVYQSRLRVIDRNVDKLEVLLAQARQRLMEMHVYSPVDGIVNEIYVKRGAYVEDGDDVLLMHEPDELWIEADIDESEIRHVHVGQPVLVELDAYPFEHFDGTVKAVGHVTRSNVENAGSVSRGRNAEQKIPIVIDFPPMGKPVWPGMRAAVNIVIR